MKFSEQQGNQLVEIRGIPRLETRLRNQRLRWFAHILKKPKDSLTLKVYNMNLEGRKPVGRPKKTWKKCVEEDLEILGLEEKQAFEKDLWKLKISSNPFEKGKMT